MLVTKPIDLTLLDEELATAGVAHRGLGLSGTRPETGDEQDLHTYTVDGQPTDLPTEAEPIVEAHDATKPDRTAAFESAEDAERLRLVNERARTDPAYAALAELILGRKGS